MDLSGPTTLHFCEQATTGWIRQPANAWSSLAFVLIGAFILAERTQARSPARSRFRNVLGLAAIAIGLASFYFHATLTFRGELLDLGSMFLFSAALLTTCFARLSWISTESWSRSFAGIAFGSLFIHSVVHFAGIYLFAAQVVLILGSETLLIAKQSPKRVRRASLVQGLVLFSLSFILWLLDFHGIACVPSNPLLQGHAAWHLLNAAAYFRFYRYYVQFA